VLHSLKQHSRAFQGTSKSLDGPLQIERAHWQSTPLNYLEKIFQIPLALQPMPRNGYERLMQHLTEEKNSEPQDGAPNVAAKPSEQIPALGSNESLSPETAPSPLAEPVLSRPMREDEITLGIVRPFNPNPKYLQLGDHERAFMDALYPLVPSPRAAKRFVNIYRLLRISINEERLTDFPNESEAAEYKAVLLLLAIQTGYPEQAVQIIHDLAEQKPKKRWWEFVHSYHSRAKNAPRKNPRPKDLQGAAVMRFDAADRYEAERWTELLRRLDQLRHEIPPRQTCKAFIKWGPHVAHYSFRSALPH